MAILIFDCSQQGRIRYHASSGGRFLPQCVRTLLEGSHADVVGPDDRRTPRADGVGNRTRNGSRTWR
ncbi:hypothetical protein D8S78_12910 [Natrialba swarupiae]|nr:hypothetical protein [Natrialba swarupiae]